MKVHITLVGGQPMPVYHGIVANPTDLVVFICSGKTKTQAETIKKEIGTSSKFVFIDPVDLIDINSKVEQLAEQYKNDEVSINISGGTKPWSYYFAKIFGDLPNATLFYVDQNNELWDLKQKSHRNIPFDVEALFRIKGNPLNYYFRFEDYTMEDRKAAYEIDSFRQTCYKQKVLKEFNDVTAVLAKEDLEQLNLLDEGTIRKAKASVTWKKGSMAEVTICGTKSMTLHLKSPHVEKLLFNSGWYEYLVADELSKWDKVREIRMNCLFPLRESTTESDAKNNLKNEIDIIAVTDLKPIFIECKAGHFNSTDIDKFKNAVENYGGRGSKSVFVTGGWLEKVHFEKFKDSKIPYAILRSSSKSNLIEMLDKHLLDIND